MTSPLSTGNNQTEHTRTYFDEEKLVILRGSGSMKRQAVDDFAELCSHTVANPRYGSPFLGIVDVSHPNQGFTPYSNKRFLQVMDSFLPDYQYFVGIVVTNHIFQMLLNIFLKPWLRRHSNVTFRFFADEAVARKWLQKTTQQS